jgi:hypothetical protein
MPGGNDPFVEDVIGGGGLDEREENISLFPNLTMT